MTATTFLFGAGTHGVRPSSGAARPSMFGGFPHEAFPDPDAHGVVILDRLVSEAKSRTVALALSEERLRFTQEAGRIGSWTLDLATMSLESSDGCKANFGRDPGADFTYEAWIEGVHPDDRARMRDAISSAIAGQTHYDHEYRITYPDGAVHWIHARGHASYQPDGRPLTIAGISLDITDRRRAEAHRDLLAKELAHRVKNTLATVQSIIRQTLRRSASLEEAEAILDARIMALAAAHDVLIRDTWEGGDPERGGRRGAASVRGRSGGALHLQRTERASRLPGRSGLRHGLARACHQRRQVRRPVHRDRDGAAHVGHP